MIFKCLSQLSDMQKEFVAASLAPSYPDIALSFSSMEISFDEKGVKNPDLLIATIKKLIFISKGLAKKKILYQREVNLHYEGDPIKELAKTGEVLKVGEGLFQFQGEFLKIFRACNNYFLDVALSEFNAVEQEHPVLWPIDLFKKVDYFKEFPHQAMLVTGVKKDFDILSEFGGMYSKENDFSSLPMNDKFEDAQFGLQPAVCDTCYYALSGKQNHVNTTYTTYNKVFRNESSESGSLDRLMCFSVRDIMFVGDKEYVLFQRQKLIERLTAFFESTGLKCSIEVSDDPFFSADIEKKMFQHSFELKYEILADIPFLNKRIAVGSINLHLDTFGQAFNIASRDGSAVYSGCIGIGFERLMLAFYSQFGVDVFEWPSTLKKSIGVE